MSVSELPVAKAMQVEAGEVDLSVGILEKAWLLSLWAQLPCLGINSQTWPDCKENKTVCDEGGFCKEEEEEEGRGLGAGTGWWPEVVSVAEALGN